MDTQKKTQMHIENTAEAKLFNFRPIFFFAIALALGVGFAYACAVHGVSLWWLLCLLPICVVILFFVRNRRLGFIALCTLFIAFSLGYCLSTAQLKSYLDVKTYEGEFTVCGRVVEKGITKTYSTLVLDGIIIGEKTETGKLLAYLPTAFYDGVRLSDKVSLRGFVVTDVAVKDDARVAVRIYDNVKFKLSSAQIEQCFVIGHQDDLFLDIRQRVIDGLFAGMDETAAAVTMAALLGDTSTVEQSLLDNMRYGGIAHLFAVSGLHIGALYAFCRMLVTRTPVSKTPKGVRFALTAVTLLFYGGVCGYSASVVRAIITCLAFDVGKSSGYLSDSLENAGLAAIAILCLSPIALFTVGFQLSFAAALGIILLSRPIQNAFERGAAYLAYLSTGKRPAIVSPLDEKPPLGIRQRVGRSVVSFLSVTIAAQTATFPILLCTFGYVSIWTLFLNCLFVPVVSGLFSLILSLVVISCLLPVAWGGVVLYVPSVIWSALLLIFQTADFSVHLLRNVTLSVETLIVYYTALLFCTDKWNIPKALKKGLIGACGVAFLVLIALLNI